MMAHRTSRVTMGLSIGGLVCFYMILLSCSTLSSSDTRFQDTGNRIQIRRAPVNQRKDFSSWFLGLTSDGQGPALSLRVSMGDLESLSGEVELTSPLLPAFRFLGTLSRSGPAELLLQIHSVRFFDNWNNGWTEGEADAFGTLIFRREYLRWWANLRDPLGIGEVRFGEVRYLDRYYRGEEGTRRVRVCVQRLLEKVALDSKGTRDSDTEETPKLYLSLLHLSRLNQQLEKEELIFLPSED